MVKRVNPDTLFSLSQSTIPIVAYFDLRPLQIHRKIHIKKIGSKGQKKNEPGKRRREILWRRTVPANPTEDPYIVATLIALAQAQRRQTSIKDQSDKTATPDGASSNTDEPIPQDASPSSGTVPTAEKSSYKVRNF